MITEFSPVTDLLLDRLLKGLKRMNFEDLKTEVAKILVTKYDFLTEEAESAVEESVAENTDMWNDNAEASDLANYLASDDDDE